MGTMYVLIVCLLLKIVEGFIPPIDLHNFPFNISVTEESCRKDINIFAQSLENNTLWAYKLWDSIPKYSLALTEGSQYQLGDFHECIAIKKPFKTQYCLTTIQIQVKINHTNTDPFDLQNKPFNNVYEKIDYLKDPAQVPRNVLYWGLCLPRSCTAKQFEKDFEIYLNKIHNKYVEKYSVILNDNNCEYKGKNRQYEAKDYMFCILVGLLISTIAISTILEHTYLNDTNKTKKLMKIMLCFSITQNIKDICKTEGGNEKFKVFYGVKFLMTVGLIMGHNFANIMTGSIFNFICIEKVTRLIKFMPIARGDVIVDTFFLITAILNTYSFLDQNRKKKYNMIRSIIIRYFRSMPLFALVSFFYTTLLYKIGSGPLWPQIIGPERDNCLQNWWTNILFINNYINVENQCILQTWYIAIDFQLFLISIPLNYLILINNVFSWILFSIIFLVSILIPFLTVYLNNLEPFYFVFNNFFATLRKTDFYKYMYVPSHTRMSTYIIGMIFGYFYYKYKDREFKLSKFKSFFIFSKLSFVSSCCMMTGVIFYNPYHQNSALSNALYAALHRSGFVIAAGLMLFLISYKLVPSFFMTSNLMTPLSKLCFGVYIIHFVFQQIKVASSVVPLNFTILNLIYNTTSDTCICLMIAFVLYILIENPFGKLIKELIPENFLQENNKTQSKENVNP